MLLWKISEQPLPSQSYNSGKTMEPDEIDPVVLLLTCPHCKTRCNSTTALFNHMEFPGNDCLAHLEMDMKQFKKQFNSRQVMARQGPREDFNRRRREKVSPRNPFAIRQIEIGHL